jgi:hypothetical protein
MSSYRTDIACLKMKTGGSIRSNYSKLGILLETSATVASSSHSKLVMLRSALEVPFHNGKREIPLGCRQETQGADNSLVNRRAYLATQVSPSPGVGSYFVHVQYTALQQ